MNIKELKFIGFGILFSSVFWLTLFVVGGESDHAVKSISIKNLRIDAVCRSVSSGTIAPFARVFRGKTEIASSMIHPGFDMLRDCEESVIGIAKSDLDNEVLIELRSGEIKRVGFNVYPF